MRYSFFLLFVILVTVSCKKDPAIEPIPVLPMVNNEIPISEFSQLKIGNYWIYARYQVDTNGVETCLAPRDSSYISGDTIINGNLYHIKVGGFWGIGGEQYLRDSADYLVNHLGHVLFSSSDFENVLYAYQGEYIGADYQMASKDVNVTTPLGDFSTYELRGTIYLAPGLDNWGSPRYTSVYRAPGIGLVKEILFFVSQPGTVESRLIKFSTD